MRRSILIAVLLVSSVAGCTSSQPAPAGQPAEQSLTLSVNGMT